MDKDLERTYLIVRTLENGEQTVIASRDDLGEARTLAAWLSEYWSGDFSVGRSD
jgi:hypothetical protein